MVTKKKSKSGAHRNGDSSPRPTSDTVPDLLEEDCQKLRTHLLNCPGVSSKSPAVTSLLVTLDSLKHSHKNGTPTAAVLNVAKIEPAPRRPSKPSKVGIALRAILIDLPLLMIFAVYLSLVVLGYVKNQYLIPQFQLMEYTEERKESELTYYNRVCNLSDVSTTNIEDLVMQTNVSAEDAMEHMLKHGVSVYPQVLSPSTADEVRSFILKENEKADLFYVIEQKHRYSFGIGVHQHPSIAKALHEIGTHPTLVPALEAIAGPNPSVIEFTAITSEYGAEEQWWHQDTLPSGSSFKHARSFFPSYSLFIPLQDTTAAMGSTEVCPGSHVCDDNDTMCKKGGGFKVSGPRDKWHKGHGALVNQHLHHRGTAHTHKGGLKRVLFILTFAPRPLLTDDRHVETRSMSLGGSYSIHWSNWGHTLKDFRDAPTSMAEPWKTLRALGLYKPSEADWGWDMVTTTSMRISSDSGGYSQENLDDFLEKGGFWFLPTFLHGIGDEGWVFFLEDTVALCISYALYINVCAVGGYLALATLVGLVAWMRGTNRGSFLWRCIRRLIISHVLVALVAGAAVYHISQTPWAKNIQYGKSYRLELAPVSDEIMAVATLPNRADVLVDTRYHSPHLHSYNHIIERTHPGNININKMVEQNSLGYAQLPVAMKRQLLSTMVEWAQQQYKSRFLTNFDSGSWSVVPVERARHVCHEELMKRSHPIARQLLTQLAYLRSEAKFGYLRATAMHRRHIPGLLRSLRDGLIDAPGLSSTKGLLSPSSTLVVESRLSLRQFKLAPIVLDTYRRRGASPRTPLLFPPWPAVEEPFPGAWIEGKGVVVEGKYNCKHNEWYRGTLMQAVSADTATYRVRYDDGDVDEALPQHCIRPFVPYAEEEAVAIRVENDFYGGRVVKVRPDQRYDVLTYGSGLHENVTTADIRRVDVKLQKGAAIEAKFQGQGIWYPGKVTKVNADGTFDVRYGDGDVEREVEPEHIRVALF